MELSDKEKELRKPPPPEYFVGALHDSVHIEHTGKPRPAKTNSRKAKKTINELEVLSLIECQLLTMTDMAYTFDVPEYVMHQVLVNLHDRRLIKAIDDGFWAYFCLGKPKPLKYDRSTFFTLTMRGFFKVNPIITWRA